MSTKHTSEKAEAAMLIAILVILAALTSCKPVEYKELAAGGIDTSASLNGEAISSGSLISVFFKAIPGARSYGYTFPDGSDKPAPGVITDFRSGIYGMTINLYSGEEYSSVTIWASPYVDPSAATDPGWVSLGTIPVSHEIPDINTVKPEGFVSERTGNSATIVMTDEPFPGQMVYDVTADNGKVSFTQEANILYLDGLSNEALTVTIHHAYKPSEGEDPVFGTETASFDLETAEFSIFVDISVSEDGESILISDPSAFKGYDEIWLVNIDEDNDSYEITDATEPFVFSRFDAGLFQIQAKKENEVEPSLASNIIQYTTPLSMFIDENKGDERSGRQHYWLSIPVAEGITGADFEAVIIEKPDLEPSITISGGMADISFSDLSSLSDYTAVIAAGDSYYRDAFTTKSFEGVYSFKGTVIYTPLFLEKKDPDFSFTVNVVENEKDYRYLIYAADPGVASETIRISPLYATALGDYSEENPIPYDGSSSYQKAYQWNNAKWNSSIISPENWRVLPNSTVKIDYYEYFVQSSAAGFQPVTKTSFEFVENDDSSAVLIFYNKIQGNENDADVRMGNNALKKNANPAFGDDKYTFRLYLQEEN